MTIYNSRADRIADTPLALRLDRFAGPDDRSLWRLGVSRYIGSPALIEIDADLRALTELRRFVDAAIAIIETDGGRKPTKADD